MDMKSGYRIFSLFSVSSAPVFEPVLSRFSVWFFCLRKQWFQLHLTTWMLSISHLSDHRDVQPPRVLFLYCSAERVVKSVQTIYLKIYLRHRKVREPTTRALLYTLLDGSSVCILSSDWRRSESPAAARGPSCFFARVFLRAVTAAFCGGHVSAEMYTWIYFYSIFFLNRIGDCKSRFRFCSFSRFLQNRHQKPTENRPIIVKFGASIIPRSLYSTIYTHSVHSKLRERPTRYLWTRLGSLSLSMIGSSTRYGGVRQ